MLDTSEVLDLMNKTFRLALQLCMPLLLVSMIVGIVIAIFQAATQIHEQTVTFLPKLLAIIAVLSVTGSTMLATCQNFFREICTKIIGG